MKKSRSFCCVSIFKIHITKWCHNMKLISIARNNSNTCISQNKRQKNAAILTTFVAPLFVTLPRGASLLSCKINILLQSTPVTPRSDLLYVRIEREKYLLQQVPRLILRLKTEQTNVCRCFFPEENQMQDNHDETAVNNALSLKIP